MSMIAPIIALLVLVIVLYVIENLLPLEQTIRRVIEVVLILVVCIWLLRYAAVF